MTGNHNLQIPLLWNPASSRRNSNLWISGSDFAISHVLRNALFERLDKADGHINAAERHLNNSRDRGLWSAHQARARLAEIELWLNQPPRFFPPVEYKLSQSVTRQLIKQQRRLNVENPYLKKIEMSEQLLISRPEEHFRRIENEQQRARLHEAIELKSSYIKALRNQLKQLEKAVAVRFLNFSAGQWLEFFDPTAVRQHPKPVYVLKVDGLHIDIFFPGSNSEKPKNLTRSLFLLYQHRHLRLSESFNQKYHSLGYFWLEEAKLCLENIRKGLQLQQPLSTIRLEIISVVDALSRAWAFQFEPENCIYVSWKEPNFEQIQLLESHKDKEVIYNLSRIADRIEAIGWQIDDNPNIALQFGILQNELHKACEQIETEINPWIP